MNRMTWWPSILLLALPLGCTNDSGPGIAPPPPGRATAAAPAQTPPPNASGPALQPAKLPGLSVAPKAQ